MKIKHMMSFAGAAAGGLLGASELDADIVYSGPMNLELTGNQTEFLDFDSDGSNDMRLAIFSSSSFFGNTSQGTTLTPFQGNGATLFGGASLNTEVTKFGAGDLISGVGAADDSIFGQRVMEYTSASSSGFGGLNDFWGAFAASNGSTTGFAGFEFNSGLNGWMEIKIETSGSTPATRSIDKVTLLGYAYEDESGVGITAGATSSVPEPSSGLALLALGAAGFLRRRRKI